MPGQVTNLLTIGEGCWEVIVIGLCGKLHHFAVYGQYEKRGVARFLRSNLCIEYCTLMVWGGEGGGCLVVLLLTFGPHECLFVIL